MNSQKLSLTQLFGILLFLFILSLSAIALSAWTGPTGTAPAGNISAPINTSATDQIKAAGVSVNALTVFGTAYVQNKLGIGTSTPHVALEVNGTLKLGNGGEACQSVSEGAIRYNSSSSTIQYCNGNSWGSL